MATRKTATAKAKPAKPAPLPKSAQTKQQRLIEMLKRPDGATIAQLSKAFGWQPHTVRGTLSGALKKKLGLKVVSAKAESGARIYRIA